jgi:hypothetical protein
MSVFSAASSSALLQGDFFSSLYGVCTPLISGIIIDLTVAAIGVLCCYVIIFGISHFIRAFRIAGENKEFSDAFGRGSDINGENTGRKYRSASYIGSDGVTYTESNGRFTGASRSGSSGGSRRGSSVEDAWEDSSRYKSYSSSSSKHPSEGDDDDD